MTDTSRAVPSIPVLSKDAERPLILVVEDNDDNLLLLQYVLDNLNYRFIGIRDSESALACIRQHQPQLVLLDIILPTIDGIQVLKSLKLDPLTAHIPIIAVTAMARKEDRKDLLAVGFSDYLSKPYMLDDLEHLLVRYVS